MISKQSQYDKAKKVADRMRWKTLKIMPYDFRPKIENLAICERELIDYIKMNDLKILFNYAYSERENPLFMIAFCEVAAKLLINHDRLSFFSEAMAIINKGYLPIDRVRHYYEKKTEEIRRSVVDASINPSNVYLSAYGVLLGNHYGYFELKDILAEIDKRRVNGSIIYERF